MQGCQISAAREVLRGDAQYLFGVALGYVDNRGQQVEGHGLAGVSDLLDGGATGSFKDFAVNLAHSAFFDLAQQRIPLVIEAQEALAKVDIEGLIIGTA